MQLDLPAKDYPKPGLRKGKETRVRDKRILPPSYLSHDHGQVVVNGANHGVYFPVFSPIDNPSGENFRLFCQFRLVRYSIDSFVYSRSIFQSTGIGKLTIGFITPGLALSRNNNSLSRNAGTHICVITSPVDWDDALRYFAGR